MGEEVSLVSQCHLNSDWEVASVKFAGVKGHTVDSCIRESVSGFRNDVKKRGMKGVAGENVAVDAQIKVIGKSDEVNVNFKVSKAVTLGKEKSGKVQDADAPVIQRTRETRVAGDIDCKNSAEQSVWDIPAEFAVDVDELEAANLQPKRVLKHVEKSSILGISFSGSKDADLRVQTQTKEAQAENEDLLSHCTEYQKNPQKYVAQTVWC